MTLLAVDVGTTHCKVGLFDEQGQLLALSSHLTPLRKDKDGSTYDPQALWKNTVTAIRDVMDAGESPPIAAIGISSMAETGLLLSPASGEPQTSFFPWFDPRTIPQAEAIAAATDVPARFLRTGMRPTFKCAVSRLLWLREEQEATLRNVVWLSVADYLAYRLCGVLATDDSLACRTYAFVLHERQWDQEWLKEWKLSAALFPQVLPAGTIVGRTSLASGRDAGIAAGVPVTIGGHDHVCAAFAAGAIQRGIVFDSMGTAETLVGGFAARDLQLIDFDSGFTFGRHVTPDAYYWMGGLSTSGGSVEWLRTTLSDTPLSYEALNALVQKLPDLPTGILYFPYLAGSGSPHSDERMPAVIAGLRQEHGRAHLVKGVLEGVAYEMEWIRRAAEKLHGVSVERIVAGGGGARNKHWLQIKADVSGLPVDVMPVAETTLLGAAMIAGRAAGVYDSVTGAPSWKRAQPSESLLPDPERHQAYRRLFEEGYLSLQHPLRQVLPFIGREYRRPA